MKHSDKPSENKRETSSRSHESGEETPFVERRKIRDRRRGGDRRSHVERRHDFRNREGGQRMSLRVWLRSKTKSRLGVDRRKGERRSLTDRRQPKTHVLLTRDEIADLLSTEPF